MSKAVEVVGTGSKAYRCPGCDREAHVYIMRTTLHRFGNNGLVYRISCRRPDDPPLMSRGRSPNDCLGEWFNLRPFESETSAVSTWNDSIIEMAAAALGISPRDARALKEGRAILALKDIVEG